MRYLPAGLGIVAALRRIGGQLLLLALFSTLIACETQSAQFQRAMQAYADGHFQEARVALAPLAEQGYAPAQFRLGTLYAQGLGTVADPDTALRWYERAADQGNISAQFYLARMYLEDTEIGFDPEQARRWFEKLGEQGYAPAQFQLSVMYRHGVGTAPDATRADDWLARAARQGYQPAVKIRAELGAGTN